MMQKKRNLLFLGSLTLLLIVVGVGLGGYILWAYMPDLAATSPPTPITVTLTRPVNGAVYAQTAVLDISAAAYSEQLVTQFEFWVDGVLTSIAEVDGSSTATRMNWGWSPTSSGEHVLLVRAVDGNGRINQSNVVRVTTTDVLRGVVLERYTAVANDTPETIAAAHNLTPADITAYNQNLVVGQSIPAGQIINIPQPLPPTETTNNTPAPNNAELAPPPDSYTEAAPSNPMMNWFQFYLAAAPTTAPTAPQLTAYASGCAVNLYLTDVANNEWGFTLYRLGAKTTTFVPIAQFGASQGNQPLHYSESGLTGQWEYYAVAYNAAGQTMSNLVNVAPTDPACNPPDTDSSDLQIENGELILPQPVDELYFYAASTNPSSNNRWTRFPTNPNTFIPAQGRKATVGTNLAETGAYEAWGWQDGTLIFLGSGQAPAPQDTGIGATLLPNLPSTQSNLEIIQPSRVEGESTTYWTELDTSWDILHNEFRWQSSSTLITEGIWQVSPFPFTNAPDLEPIGLVASGKIALNSGLAKFPIDFRPFVHPPQPFTSDSPVGSAELNDTTATNHQLAPLSLINMAPGEQAVNTAAINLPYFGTYYVRVIPMAGNQIYGEPSNTVQINIVPPMEIEIMEPESPPSGSPYIAKIIDFIPPVYIWHGLVGCIELTHSVKKPVHFLGVIIEVEEPTVSILCPSEDDFDLLNPFDYVEAAGEGLAKAFEWATSAWDWSVDQINYIRAEVVSFSAPFNPLCIQYQFFIENGGQKYLDSLPDELAGNLANETPQESCESVLNMGVDAAFIAHGIPPTLPKSKELMEQGHDYLVELAIETLKDLTGADCNQICRDLLSKGFDIGLGYLDNDGTSQTTSGATIRPAPGSMYEPPMILVEITRDPNFPVSEEDEFFKVCNFQGTATLADDTNKWEVGLETKSLPLPQMPLGSQLTLLLPLNVNPAQSNGIDVESYMQGSGQSAGQWQAEITTDIVFQQWVPFETPVQIPCIVGAEWHE
ncbi:MAG: LysM peptidoglycan-binding domain-containing protein [Chloroflexi bacterium]|nr:LysM peptidoglycan-binding domain-containing protein [Chloroflexota bacterium]